MHDFLTCILNKNDFSKSWYPKNESGYEVIFKNVQFGLDGVFKYEEFVLVPGKAEDWNEFRVLESPV